MTKKHFEAFAADIKELLDVSGSMTPSERRTANKLANAQCSMVSRVASRFNPRFDRDRFRTACGLK